ncbi:MAG: 6-hydroxymethylpterin diphosphokinase MptE-like protein [Candidatus Thorarchaeota archaeon]
MLWNDWKPFYFSIVEQLGIDPCKDREATVVLGRLLENSNPSTLLDRLEMIRNRDVVVFGGGPSLENHIKIVLSNSQNSDTIFMAADGAVTALLEQDLICDFVVTDLDGNKSDILKSIREGTTAIVHAHGDNIPALYDFIPRVEDVLGSTQVEPLSNVFLWGGFTDGDRACYIASHYSPRRIILAGMDFGQSVGKWSKPGHRDSFRASPRKLVKLKIAQELLSHLWSTTGIVHSYVQ